MLTLFTLPADFATATLAYVGDLVNDLSSPIYLIVGIALGIMIINFIVGLFTRRAKVRG